MIDYLEVKDGNYEVCLYYILNNNNKMNNQPSINNISTIPKESVIVLFSKINSKLGVPSTVAQLYITSKDFSFAHKELCANLGHINKDKLNILIVHKNLDESKFDDINKKSYFYNDPRTLIIGHIEHEDIVKYVDTLDANNKLGHTLFIFQDDIWAHVVQTLKLSRLDLNITGGTNNKRHVVSVIESKLIIYMFAIFNFDCTRLYLHNGFDTSDKVLYLPFYDFSNKSQIRFRSAGGPLVSEPTNK